MSQVTNSVFNFEYKKKKKRKKIFHFVFSLSFTAAYVKTLSGSLCNCIKIRCSNIILSRLVLFVLYWHWFNVRTELQRNDDTWIIKCFRMQCSMTQTDCNFAPADGKNKIKKLRIEKKCPLQLMKVCLFNFFFAFCLSFYAIWWMTFTSARAL